jgi:UDP-2,3-diacylglucosamine pyrophosphatase LpxH
MPDIRYVCLSDLHFGAENSILSCLVAGDVIVDTTTASSVLDSLVAGLRSLIGANERKDPKPTLILNGDVLELALASDNVALMVFELFLDRIFPADGEALFDHTILYQPGNHDHHLWETAREVQYAHLMKELGPDTPLPIPWHATKLYYQEDQRPVFSELLEQLARRRPHRADINVRVSYPDMALRSDDGQTSIVFHHGHYVESIYHLMSTLKDAIFPGRPAPTEVWDIEAENFAWIDFFWSTLGRSGDVGEDVGLIYDMLQSDAAIEKLAGNLATTITAQATKKGVAAWFRWLIRPAVDKVLKVVATRVASTERKTPKEALSANAQTGLMDYLAGPLIKQLAAEAPARDGALPGLVKVVFGHTHKPFVATRVVPGLANPVRIFNTGGWVVDTLAVEPLHGANMVLVDENLEVACVRLYNQAADPAAYRVRLDDGLPAEQGPFYQRLSGLVRADEEPWKGFSAAAAALVSEREKALAAIIANAGKPRPSGSPITPPKPPAPPVAQTPSATLARGRDPGIDQSDS